MGVMRAPHCPAQNTDLQLGPIEETVPASGWRRNNCWTFCSFLLLFGLLLPLLRKLLIEGRLGLHLCFGPT